jgi:hypothetical protein
VQPAFEQFKQTEVIMNDSYKPVSTFDEICHLTIETMRTMEMETIMQLRKQAIRELDRAKLTKACLDAALSLKTQELDEAVRAEDDNQPSLLD